MNEVLEGEAFDEAMDSLTRSQRNRLLDKSELKRLEAKQARAYQRLIAEGPEATRETWWVRFFWRSLWITGLVLKSIGEAVAYVGGALVRVSEKVS